MENTRHLSNSELNIVSALIDASDPKWEFLKAKLPSVYVSIMNDGGMGSLLFEAEGSKERRLGTTISEAEFNDSDGVLVSIVLNLDENNNLFELDVWKVDFSKLITLPEIGQLRFSSK